MTKRTLRQDVSSRVHTLERAMATLRVDLGYEDVVQRVVEGEPCAIASVNGRPIVLLYVPDRVGAILPADQEVATQLGAVLDGGPAEYVWATTSGKLRDGFMYSWLPD